jgi:hypothetical protein
VILVDKYDVLIFLIVYYIVIVITTAVFQGAQTIISPGSQATGGADALWSFIKIFWNGLWVNIPLLPVVVRANIGLTFWALLFYFIYLNLPNNQLVSSPEP